MIELMSLNDEEYWEIIIWNECSEFASNIESIVDILIYEMNNFEFFTQELFSRNIENSFSNIRFFNIKQIDIIWVANAIFEIIFDAVSETEFEIAFEAAEMKEVVIEI